MTQGNEWEERCDCPCECRELVDNTYDKYCQDCSGVDLPKCEAAWKECDRIALESYEKRDTP